MARVRAELPIKSSHQSKLDKLKGAKEKDFSSEFDAMQVSAHKDAVDLFERYAKGGDNPDLKDWSGKTLPTLQHHLKMAQDLDKAGPGADENGRAQIVVQPEESRRRWASLPSDCHKEGAHGDKPIKDRGNGR